MSQDEADFIAESIMRTFAEDCPADPTREDTWCLSQADFRKALLLAVEQTQEAMFDPEAVGRVTAHLQLELDEARLWARRLLSEIWTGDVVRDSFRPMPEWLVEEIEVGR